MPHAPLGRRSEAGFGVIALMIAMVGVGLLAAALLRFAGSSVETTRTREKAMSAVALKTARDALIAFAAQNNGCLPFAADFEGGLPDTDATGAATPGYADTGEGKVDLVFGFHTYAGDLPWADLGLGPDFLDGNGLRVQYYVASPYTDDDVTDNVVACAAGFRGVQWDTLITYDGSASPIYVYCDVGCGFAPSDRRLYKIDGPLPTGMAPNDPAAATIAFDVTATPPFPASLLELRQGPDVTAAAPQSDVVSAQNAFVLIAPGNNGNAFFGRPYVRDSTHVNDDLGGPWPLDLTGNPDEKEIIDTAIFSDTQNIDPTDEGNDGDDTLLGMSFNDFKTALSKYGLNMEPICEGPC